MASKESGLIGFSLPERRKPERSFEVRPKKIAAWAAQLPRANVEEMARQVFSILHDSNRFELGWKNRYLLLEALREPANYAGWQLHKSLKDMSLPLPDKAQQIASLAIYMDLEMALGYQTALEDMLVRNILFRSRQALIVMLHRCASHLVRILLGGYAVYFPAPPERWLDLHRLYRYGESKRLHNKRVDDPVQAGKAKNSLSALYKQALLLELATPFRLRQGEVLQLATVLESWANYARLEPYATEVDKNSSVYLVDFNSSRAPTHISFDQKSCAAGQCRLLRLEALNRTLEKEIRLAGKKNGGLFKRRQAPPLPIELLQRLHQGYLAPAKRSHQRNKKEAQVDVAIGLTNIHRHLGLHKARQSPLAANAIVSNERLFDTAAAFSSRVVSAESDEQDDVWNMFAYPSGAQNTPKPTREAASNQHSALSPPVTWVWAICDESEGGYRLARAANEMMSVKVGDLVAVRQEADEQKHAWAVGTVRWIQFPQEERLEMGIQKLSEAVHPVAACLLRADGGRGAYQRTLLFSGEPAKQISSMILGPGRLFNAGDTLLIRSGAREYQLKLLDTVESNSVFSLFSFQPLKPPQSKITAKRTMTAGARAGLQVKLR